MRKNKENQKRASWWLRFLRFIFKPFFNGPKSIEIKVESYDKSIIKMGLKNTKQRYRESWLSIVGDFVKGKTKAVLACMGIVTTGTIGNRILARLIDLVAKIKFFM